MQPSAGACTEFRCDIPTYIPDNSIRANLYFVVGATVSRSSLHLLPHRDKKTKQAKVVTKEEEVASKEKNPEEKVAQEENAEIRTSRGGAICDPIEKGSNSGNIIKTQRQMPHYSVDIQKLDIYINIVNKRWLWYRNCFLFLRKYILP